MVIVELDAIKIKGKILTYKNVVETKGDKKQVLQLIMNWLHSTNALIFNTFDQ